MPHKLALNTRADALWFQFLATDQIDRKTKSEILLGGLTPPMLLNSRAREDMPIAELRRLLCPGAALWETQARSEVSGTLIHLGERMAAADGMPHYPALLAEVPDAPLALFVSGDSSCLRRPAIAIVGTRRPSRDGLRLAEQVAYELAAAGFLVVSGLARGIDAAAHRGALRSGGQTLAVMATGLDRIYPANHRSLAQEIQAQGALLTEFCPGASPHRWHFPRRNHTLAGLCLATVVIEAGRPSGSLITATAAVQQGREVFAAPWSLFHKNGAGCLYLLSEGAHIINTPARLIEHLGVNLKGWAVLQDNAEREVSAPATFTNHHLGPKEAGLLRLLGDGEMDLATLVAETGLSGGDLLALVSRLELAGYVEQTHAGLRALRKQ